MDSNKPAERTAGCTRVVYNMPNIYELTVVAVLEERGHHIQYRNFVLENETFQKTCFNFIEQDDSDLLFLLVGQFV